NFFLNLLFNPDYSLANLKGKSNSEELFYSPENHARLFFKAILRSSLLLIFQNMHQWQKFCI
ncbi:MAG TPA: hypothetical protein P5157_06445, partial [Paludibacteraceae bacterium]|nr:hypothetical protein [Paludibacteraceae bacterium]